jgi:hypothetical protein
VAVVGSILYAARDELRPSVDASLRRWAVRSGIDTTAFARLYAGSPPEHDRSLGAGREHGEEICSPLPLTATQEEAVRRARHESVVAISGPPGSGKSHTVAAIASDAVTSGGSVLVAARSEHAAAVVADLLDRQAGPDPVRFGGTNRDELVAQVTQRGIDAGEVRRAHASLDAARARRDLAERAIVRRLDLEASTARAASWDGLVGELTAVAPGAFAPDSDLDELTALLETATSDTGSWWRRWRARRADRRLRDAGGIRSGASLDDVRTALRCAVDRRDAARLAAGTGTVLGPAWEQLRRADAAVLEAAGQVAEAEAAREDRRRRGRSAAGALATALRAGRRQRQRLLRSLDGRTIADALPLWVGTLGDIADLLPDTPGLFDLVILDEASQIDQALAAGALLRARRAVVVGDPRQLRHVSFVADDEVTRSLGRHGLAGAAAVLDVRRNSVLDVAAGVTHVTWLDEHHRSLPHLIEFSARRFYDGRLTVATRHPHNEATDVIDVVRTATGTEPELEAALGQVRQLADGGATDIAIITPFRDLADAAQAAVLAAYPAEDIERLRLRVGTVHAFQGAEADHAVLVLGLTSHDPAGRRRFVEDPHLFNVFVTRARRTITVVTGLPPRDAAHDDGLIDQYLAHAERSPAPPHDRPVAVPWAAALGRELAAAGVGVRTGYPVGRWVVDLCIGEGVGAVAVDVAVHPSGAPEHIRRHRSLAGAGWLVLDGYPSRWDGDPARAAIELAGELGRAHPVDA